MNVIYHFSMCSSFSLKDISFWFTSPFDPKKHPVKTDTHTHTQAGNRANASGCRPSDTSPTVSAAADKKKKNQTFLG